MKVRNFKAIGLVLLMSSVCAPSQAALVWINNLTIKSYKIWSDGANSILTISFKDTGWQPTGCSASDNTKSLFNYNAGAPNSLLTAYQNLAMAANMANRKVNIQVNDSFCNGNGRLLVGIEILPEE